jgi:HAD superfamily hydrolase (TIGR01450 family)
MIRALDVDGVLLDIDGVLSISWAPIPGSIDTMAWLRREGIPYRLITNTTTHTRVDLSATLREAGFDVTPDEIVTAVVATGAYLRAHHAGARVQVLSDGDGHGDLEGVDVVGPDERADVVVLGGACDAFSYAAINRVFQQVMDGAALVCMHRNLYWRTSEGLQLDGGAFISGIEVATGTTATICGKPAAAYFDAVLGERPRARSRCDGRRASPRTRRCASREAVSSARLVRRGGSRRATRPARLSP